jgi:hypothetical protein
MPAHRVAMGGATAVPHLRARRLLRLLAGEACPPTCHVVGHPIVEAYRPQAGWRWCYFDETYV